jgi:hypothetical protein
MWLQDLYPLRPGGTGLRRRDDGVPSHAGEHRCHALNPPRRDGSFHRSEDDGGGVSDLDGNGCRSSPGKTLALDPPSGRRNGTPPEGRRGGLKHLKSLDLSGEKLSLGPLPLPPPRRIVPSPKDDGGLTRVDDLEISRRHFPPQAPNPHGGCRVLDQRFSTTAALRPFKVIFRPPVRAGERCGSHCLGGCVLTSRPRADRSACFRNSGEHSWDRDHTDISAD